MRFYFLALATASLSALSLGCGMITGLSSDYKFVPDDAAASGGDSGGSDGGGTTDDGGTGNDGGGQCSVPTGVISCNCLPKNCCALANCFNDAQCAGYAQCKTACGRNAGEVCLKNCENTFPNGRDQYDNAIGTCSISSFCRNTCAL